MNLLRALSEYLRPVLYAALILLGLWSLGAAVGLVALGFQMMAGCGR